MLNFDCQYWSLFKFHSIYSLKKYTHTLKLFQTNWKKFPELNQVPKKKERKKKIIFLILIICILIDKSSLLLKKNLKEKHIRFKIISRTFLGVQWLGLHDSTAVI